MASREQRFVHREIGKKLTQLRNERHSAANDSAGLEMRDVGAVKDHPSGGFAKQAADRFDAGSLSRTIRPEESDRAALRQRKIQPVDPDHRAGGNPQP